MERTTFKKTQEQQIYIYKKIAFYASRKWFFKRVISQKCNDTLLLWKQIVFEKAAKKKTYNNQS